MGTIVTNNAQDIQTIDLILLAGQSNMRGQGQWQLRDPMSHPADTDLNVMMYQNGTQFGDDRVLPFKGLSYHVNNNVEVFGMAVPLARELYDAGHNNIAIINGAVGGSNIFDWDSNIQDGFYDTFLDKITEGIAALEGEYTVNLLGFGWQQGEANNNADTPSDEYFDALTDLITDLKNDLNSLVSSDQVDNLNVVLMEPSYGGVNQTVVPNVADAMIDYVSINDNGAIFIPTRDIEDRVPQDNIHWDAVGITDAGHRLFRALTNKVIQDPNLANYVTSKEWAGIWLTYFGNNPDYLEGVKPYLDIAAGESTPISWEQMEGENGDFDFSLLHDRLLRCKQNDHRYHFELWLGAQAAPNWIYDYGVPKILVGTKEYPDYRNKTFQYYAKRFYNAFADEIASFDQETRDRIPFIMPGFGSTGDLGLFKGSPDNPEDEYTKEEYVDYKVAMSEAFTTAFWKNENTSDFRFRWNIRQFDGDPNDPEINEQELYAVWQKENLNVQIRKQQFTVAVGYLAPDEKDQDNAQRDGFYGLDEDLWDGNPEIVVAEYNEGAFGPGTPIYDINPLTNLYWTSISGADRGINGWNLKYDFMETDYLEAYEFSSRYSFEKEPETSPVAFIALRDVLDYSDGDRFPLEQYGNGNLKRNNQIRIDSILLEYKDYGARNDDSESVTSNKTGAQYLKTATGWNDCVWNVIDRNYRRFITQIDANGTSKGYWRVGYEEDFSGDQPYGRFARGFDSAGDLDTMYFDVDDAYFADEITNNQGRLKVKIIYYEDDGGSWNFKYRAKDGTIKIADETVINIADAENGWSSREFILEDAKLDNGGPMGSDFILENVGGTNIRFHLIELDTRVQLPYTGQIHQIPGNIECEFYDEGGEGVAYHDDENKTGDLTFRANELVDLVAKGVGSNGFAVTSFLDGEWLEYTANVTEGTYDIVLHYFAENTVDGEIKVYLDDQLIATIDDVQGNVDNTMPLSIQISCKYIPGGNERVLKLEHASGIGFEIDRIDFVTSVGEVNTWIGPDLGFWNDSAANWSLNKIPNECSEVTIPSPKKVIVRKNETVISKNKVNVIDGGQLVVRDNAILTILK